LQDRHLNFVEGLNEAQSSRECRGDGVPGDAGYGARRPESGKYERDCMSIFFPLALELTLITAFSPLDTAIRDQLE